MTTNQKKILIVDDDSRNIFALSLTLRSKGYTVVSANEAAKGIAMLKQDDGIGIVLLDMMMPEMDGYEAMGRIRADEQLAGIPIVAVTAQAMPGDREKCMVAGATAYISKPVNVDALADILKTYL
ncbi:response regulator [Mucilaginibacter sp. KACC 22063]|uniref:response regulator n=1 Tax=Mucilaginibacter sp. KACC 22063 TaxID=3025666 RepID=UPI00236619E8|nr:response regulator [Mucilaginibacter sp. KACC 22063]WDF54318.1 response regulator [Mucilaginibacter sp. KACC 22063]